MRRAALVVAVLALGAQLAAAQMQTVIGGSIGDGFPSSLAKLGPAGIATDGVGNTIIGDVLNRRVRIVNSAGIISTLAGSGASGCIDGLGADSAQFKYPTGIAARPGIVYVADSLCNRVAVIASGGVTTLPFLNTPQDVALWPDGTLLASSLNANTVSKFEGGAWVTLATIAGAQPTALATDNIGLFVYVATIGQCRVYRVDFNGNVNLIAGTTCGASIGDGGPAVLAGLNQPNGLALQNGQLYVGNSLQPRVRKIDLASGIITTIAGNGIAADGGEGPDPLLIPMQQPMRLTIDGTGLLVNDLGARKVRRVQLGAVVATPTLAPTVAPLASSTPTRTITKTPTRTLTATPRSCSPGETPCIPA